MRERGRRRAAGGGLLLVAAGLLLAVTSAARAQNRPATFEALAAAEGVRTEVAQPGFGFVEQYVDGGAPVAQAVIDTLGNSKAFASNPYPGELGVTGPGLIAGLTGTPSPPPYPLIAASSFPATPEQEVRQPGYELTAKSEALTSTGTGLAGGGDDGETAFGLTKSTANVARDASTGTVTANASSTAESFGTGGVLRIGRVHATAEVSREPGGKPRRRGDVEVSGITIAGQTVGLTTAGLTLAGSSTPLPDASPLLALLEERAIEVRYVAAVETPDGIISPGVEITSTQPVPNATPVITRYVFGRARASARASARVTGGDQPADVGVGSPYVTPVAPVGSTPSGGPTLASPTRAAPRPSGSGTTAAAVPGLVSRPVATTTSAASFYLVLVVGSVVALGGAQLIRILGVRLAWIS